jgi:hypothetical protein
MKKAWIYVEHQQAVGDSQSIRIIWRDVVRRVWNIQTPLEPTCAIRHWSPCKLTLEEQALTTIG